MTKWIKLGLQLVGVLYDAVVVFAIVVGGLLVATSAVLRLVVKTSTERWPLVVAGAVLVLLVGAAFRWARVEVVARDKMIVVRAFIWCRALVVVALLDVWFVVMTVSVRFAEADEGVSFAMTVIAGAIGTILWSIGAAVLRPWHVRDGVVHGGGLGLSLEGLCPLEHRVDLRWCGRSLIRIDGAFRATVTQVEAHCGTLVHAMCPRR